MRFPSEERLFLLSRPRIGPVVVARLEEAGYSSLSSIADSGVARAVEAVAGRMQRPAWGNRRSALEQALAAWLAAAPSRSAGGESDHLLRSGATADVPPRGGHRCATT